MRWAAFNPVADSGLGIWTLGCTLKREREGGATRVGQRKSERTRAQGKRKTNVREGTERTWEERTRRIAGRTGSSRATNQFTLSLVRSRTPRIGPSNAR